MEGGFKTHVRRSGQHGMPWALPWLAQALGLWLVASLLPGVALGQTTLTWGAGGNGGTGTWINGVTSNWWNGTSNVQWSDGANRNAVFAGTAGTVTLNAGRTAGDVKFDTPGYVLNFSSATLTLSSLSGSELASTTFVGSTTGNGSVRVNPASDATFTGTIANVGSGTTSFIKDGTGRFTFGSGFSYTATGNLTLNQGILRLGTTTGVPVGRRWIVNSSTTTSTVIELADGDFSAVWSQTPGSNYRLDINNSTGVGGFAAIGGDRTVTMVNTNDVKWESGTGGSTDKFNVGELILGTADSTGKLTLARSGNINLRLQSSSTANPVGTYERTIRTGNGTAPIDAEIAVPILDSSAAGRIGAIKKVGSGVLALSAVNLYTGPTTVTEGGLWIASTGRINTTSGVTVNGSGAEFKYNSSTAYTQPLTVTQGIVSGTGTISASGGVSIATNAILSPGNSPGTQTFTTGLTLSPGGTYVWETNSGTGTAGVNWDVINVTAGGLNLSSLSSGGRFTLDLTTLTSSGSSGPMDNYTAGDSYTWRIFDANELTLPASFGSGPTYPAGTDITSLFNVVTTNWKNPVPDSGNVSVKVAADGKGIDLVVVPEPATLVLAGLGVGLAGLGAWSRRRAARNVSL